MGRHVAVISRGRKDTVNRRHLIRFGAAAAATSGAALVLGQAARATTPVPTPSPTSTATATATPTLTATPTPTPTDTASPAPAVLPAYLWADRDADDTFQQARRRLYFKDLPETKGSVINIDHYGNGSGNVSSSPGQTYGVDIHNYPGSKSALVIHQYSSVERAVTIDNTGSAPAIEINNTQNNVLNPGSDGTGDYFMLRDHGAMALRLDKDLVFRIGGTKTPTFLHTSSKALSVQVAATYNGEAMDVTKAGAGIGAALKINNYGTGIGVHVNQAGAGKGLQVDAFNPGNAGQYAALLQGYDSGMSVTTTADGGNTLVVSKGGGGAGVAARITNLGLGNSIEVRDAKIQRFTVAASGFISVLHGQNVNIIAGVGEPEGVRSAPVGSIYLRTDGGAGTSFYVKEPGASTKNGWVAK